MRLDPVFPLTQARFHALCEEARRGLPSLARRIGPLAAEILALRDAARAVPNPYPGLEGDLERLVPGDFLASTPFDRLPHLPRYLKAVRLRAERARLNPAKDAEKARQLAPFLPWQSSLPPERREAFRWMLEEFRVSLFAQELGTPQPVSARRLERFAEGEG